MPCIFCDYKTLNYRSLKKDEKIRFSVSFSWCGESDSDVRQTLYMSNIKTMFAISQVMKNPRNNQRL